MEKDGTQFKLLAQLLEEYMKELAKKQREKDVARQ